MDYFSIFTAGKYNFISNIEYDFKKIDHSDVFECRHLTKSYVDQFRFDIGAVKREWPDFIDSPISWPICSNRMRDVLSNVMKSEVMFLSLLLDAGNKNIPYNLINILNKVNCLDLAASDVDFHEETDYSSSYLEVNYPVLTKEKIPDNIDIFRLQEDPLHFFVSKRIIEIIANNKLTGIGISKVEMI